MAFTLQLVDWRDSRGMTHPEYESRDFWQYLGGPQDWESRAEAEAAAERVWIEPDCKGVAPVCVVREC
jgi:hypothetical protein